MLKPLCHRPSSTATPPSPLPLISASIVSAATLLLSVIIIRCLVCVVETVTWLKQASLWHEFCSRDAPQYGAPNRAVLVARSLSRRQGDAQFAPRRVMSCQFLKSSLRHGTHTTSPDPHRNASLRTHCYELFPRWHVVVPVLNAVTSHLSRVSCELFTKCHECGRNSFVVTSRGTLEIKFLNISKFSPRYGTHYFT